jgi:hypothetical protein
MTFFARLRVAFTSDAELSEYFRNLFPVHLEKSFSICRSAIPLGFMERFFFVIEGGVPLREYKTLSRTVESRRSAITLNDIDNIQS